MDGLIAEVAWQIVYRMTPPGYDEAIIRAGYRDHVRTATTIAAGRGFLSFSEFQKASWALRLTHEEAYLDDFRCGAALSKPRWMPWWLSAFPRLGFYKRCEARAADAAKRE